ncbi:hypothetical protein BU17DRAFT_72351 [Hysterangium stoloniferum]|nr:hypothetical protein BU17DRAFT_72351 [Hysterangium stoloniferum]
MLVSETVMVMIGEVALWDPGYMGSQMRGCTLVFGMGMLSSGYWQYARPRWHMGHMLVCETVMAIIGEAALWDPGYMGSQMRGRILVFRMGELSSGYWQYARWRWRTGHMLVYETVMAMIGEVGIMGSRLHGESNARPHIGVWNGHVKFQVLAICKAALVYGTHAVVAKVMVTDACDPASMSDKCPGSKAGSVEGGMGNIYFCMQLASRPWSPKDPVVK